MPNLKHCPKCNQDKAPSDFYTDNTRKDKKSALCKKCRGLRRNTWATDNPDKIKKYRKGYYSRNASAFRDRQLINKYGPDAVIKYAEFLQEGNGKCLVCGGDNGQKELGLDHNHITGKLRGCLCNSCNAALGHLRVDQKGIELLIKAIEYIRTHG